MYLFDIPSVSSHLSVIRMSFVLWNNAILLISFSYSKPNTVYTIALHAGTIKDYALVCSLIYFVISSANI